MAEPLRILHVVSAMNRGGTETLLMNVYRNIDKSKVQFDFVSHRQETCDYDDEIQSMGGKVYRITSLGQSGPIAYVRQLKRILSDHTYIAVHVHTDFQSGFAALAAKMAGVPKRICHSHSNQWGRERGLKDRILFKTLQSLIKFAATDYGACSSEAARFLFGGKQVGSGKVQILKNGIAVSEYSGIREAGRLSVRDEFKIPPDVKIVGHVGNLSPTKNQVFFLKVFKHLLEEDSKVAAIFVGDGESKRFLEKEARALGVLEHVRFAGVRSDISRFMQAFDAFLFPSLYEGFGITVLEAQCAGTPCVVSNQVPQSTDMGLGLISYVDLEEKLSIWSREIKNAFLKNRPDSETIRHNFSKLGFDISENVPDWLTLYGISS